MSTSADTTLAAPPPPSELDVLTPAQAAAYLQVSEEVITHAAEAGLLPGRKIGAEWRFLRLAIAEWLRPSYEPHQPLSSKERMLAVAGLWKNDPSVDALMEDIARRRKAAQTGGR
jgi:excisionase family DNA binding protein